MTTRVGVQLNASEFERKAAAAVRTESLRRRALVEMTEKLVDRQIELASDHMDTGRFLRATAQAGNAARVGKFTVPAVRQSKLHARMERILMNQVSRWQRRKTGFNRTGGWLGIWTLREIEKNLARAIEELRKFRANKDTGVLMIGMFSTSSKMATVRVNFDAYGGTGAIKSVAGTTIAILHNKEPHASLVEWRFDITKTAMRETKNAKRIAKRLYKDHLVQAGFVPG